MTTSHFGRYEIKSELGRGGMATVFLAYDPHFQRHVALKVLPQVFLHDPTFRARFEREARVIAALEHPAIVSVHDFGEQDKQPYLVMRYMPGGSLSDRLENGAISLPNASKIMQRIASALDRAHQMGIIHRDLKPANILFDQYGDAFLTDFGIVKMTGETSHLTGTAVVGTPAYMSPEQAQGEENLDGRSDIYTLGTILYQMLTGRLPYQASTPMGLAVKHITEPVPRLRQTRPEFPPALETIISKTMSKNPDDRYATAGAMARELAQVAAGEQLTPIDPPTIPEGIEPVKPPTMVNYPTVADPPKPLTSPQSVPLPPSSPAKTGMPSWVWLIGGAILFVGLCAIGLTVIVPALTGDTTPAPTATTFLLLAEEAEAIDPSTQTPQSTLTLPPTTTSTATHTPVPPTDTPPPATRIMADPLVFGQSVLGEDLVAMQFGEGENVIVIIGAMSGGYSPSGIALTERAITYFAENPSEIPESVTLYVIADLNPDSDPRPGTAEGRLNANGVDLNRNFACNWSTDATFRDEPINPGTSAFSEPETQAFSDFIVNNTPVAVLIYGARSADGLVAPGNCNGADGGSIALGDIYKAQTDQPMFEGFSLAGDSADWLASFDVPAVSILLTNYETIDDGEWETNLAGILAVLNSYQ